MRLIVMVIVILLMTVPAGAFIGGVTITASQSVYIEYNHSSGSFFALGALVADAALTPNWNVTYLHERGWELGMRHQAHDISLTRSLPPFSSASFGVRMKISERDPPNYMSYVLWVFQFGR